MFWPFSWSLICPPQVKLGYSTNTSRQDPVMSAQIISIAVLSSSKFFFFFRILLSDYNHQVDYFVTMVHAGYVCVAIIHRTLMWTTGSLTCAQMLIHTVAHSGVWTLKESTLKVTLGRKSLVIPGRWTCVNGTTVWCATNWVTSPPLFFNFSY